MIVIFLVGVCSRCLAKGPSLRQEAAQADVIIKNNMGYFSEATAGVLLARGALNG